MGLRLPGACSGRRVQTYDTTASFRRKFNREQWKFVNGIDAVSNFVATVQRIHRTSHVKLALLVEDLYLRE